MGKKKLARIEPKQQTGTTGGNGGSPPSRDLGPVVALSPEASGAVKEALMHVEQIQRQLGALIEEFEGRRAFLLRRLAEARQTYVDLVQKEATSLGLIGPDSKDRWQFNPERGEFVRQA